MEYMKIEASSGHFLLEAAGKRIVDLIFEKHNIPKSGSVLDIGPGKGFMVKLFLSWGLKVSCVDIDSVLSAEFQKAGCDFKVADLRKDSLPYADNTFDLIWCSHVIEHLPDPLHLLSECLRVLRPGGVLVIRTPDLMKFRFQFWDDPTHVRPFILNSLRKILTLAGYDDIRCSNLGLPGIRGLHRIRAYKWAPFLMFKGNELLGVARKPKGT